jgi:phage terminase large subunit-like protein|nr:MAG TPA: Large Terminase [Caudoviricetes sp.]DAY05649.1 MAG TPA: Large Terminase [Caudoviricetes sp.]
MTSRDYVAIAGMYGERVERGEIPACEWVRKAVKRQIEDQKRFSGKSSRFYFDPDEAAKVCKFIELLPHTKGQLAGQKIRLEPWQIWILTTVFGWRRTADGGRRFRRVYIEVPRGNGKSSLSSGVALYCLLADKEPGAEVYSFATTRDQAGIVFNDAKRMVQQTASLRSHFGVEVLSHALYVPKTNSTFQAKSADGSTLDGLNTHLAVVDELHAHRTRAVYDVVETSLGKRVNSLMWVITTAGFDTSGICYEVRTMVRNVLNRSVVDESQFGIIYGLDEGDDWKSLAALEKANPNWGVSVMPEVVTSLQKKAIAIPSAAGNFMTKHLDVWCSAASGWMNMPAWNKCAREELRREDFEGEPCYIGLDLGSKSDMTAKVLMFPREDRDGRTYFVTFADFYLPSRAIETSPNSQYRGWVEQGLIRVTEGAMTDFNVVEEDIREDLSRYSVQSIAYDPWQATQLISSLEDSGAPLVECRMTVQQISEPMKTLEALVLDGRIQHDGNPCLTWMMGNVVAKVDAKDNIFPRKERYEQKIDGPVAMIIALSAAGAEQDDFSDFDSSVTGTFLTW